MHPRTAVRNDLKALLGSVLSGVPVYVSRARAVRPDVEKCVLLYVMEETFSRPAGAGESRPGRPVKRGMSVFLEVLAKDTGDGEDAVDAVDEIARKIELSLNNSTQLEPVSSRTSFVEDGKNMRVSVSLQYALEHFDNMSMEAS